MTDDELRAWALCDNAHWSREVDIAVLRLLDEKRALQAQVASLDGLVGEWLSESKRAVKFDADLSLDPVVIENWATRGTVKCFDGSTGLGSTVAGRKAEGSGV